jgi:hypothetical protein
MAAESPDPKVGLIAQIGILSVGTLIVVHMGLTSYFDHMTRAEIYKKVGSVQPDALMSVRADERQRLNSGPMPIEKSMQTLIAKGRMGAAPELAPSASKDVAPLQGWTQLPSEVPAAMMAPEPAPAPSVSTAPSASAAPPASAAPSAGHAPTAPGHAPPHQP